MNIKIPAKVDCKTIIKVMICFVCIEKLLEIFGFPHMIIFLLDLANGYLLINLVINEKIIKSIRNPIIITQIIVIVIGTMTAILSGVKLILIVWAIRNLCRFWVFYCACVVFLEESDANDVFSIFRILYFINFFFTLVQFALGYRQDRLGGIFGVTVGVNGYSNIFLIIVCTYELACWVNKKDSNFNVFFILITSILIAALAEIKFFFVELVGILALIFIIDCFIKDNVKYVIRVLAAVFLTGIMLLIGILILGRLYPHFADYFTIDQFLYNNTRASGYTGHGDLNRLTAIIQINRSVFPELEVNKIFGMGLGAAEYSSWDFMKSWFYNQYSYLHYTWFSDAWMYLENGYIGLFLYPAGFLINGFMGIYKLKKRKKGNEMYSPIILTGIVLSFVVLGIYLYDQTLRMECAYMLYFCFAAMRIVADNQDKSKGIFQYNYVSS